MLRPEWRLWPFASFLGLLDLKTGVTIALLFALLNKVAGVYGLIAVLAGAGGSFAQLSLYIYSVLALMALAWALRIVHQEDPKKTLYFAHLFFADHILSTSWTIFFAVVWWLWTPHDGRRQANSAAQQAMMEHGRQTAQQLTPEERRLAAMSIWNHEKGFAAAVIVLTWTFKIYFALIIYSYAIHLRKGSYRSLPLSRSVHTAHPTSHSNTYDVLPPEDDDIEDFYRIPLRSPFAWNNRSGHQSAPASFADFVSAPGRPPRKKGGGGSNSKENGMNGDVVFDEDEATYAASTSTRSHSKLWSGTDSTVISDEERSIGHSR
jgi:hypothetical protein